MTVHGTRHPWPQPLPAAWLGHFNHPEPLPYHQIQPTLVAETRADTAFEHHKWRHRVHHRRLRTDLTTNDVPPLTEQ